MGIKRFDHRTKVKARSARQNLQTASRHWGDKSNNRELKTAIPNLEKCYKALEQDLQSLTVKETVGPFPFITQKPVSCSHWTRDQESGKYV